jgi:hypothetical protein
VARHRHQRQRRRRLRGLAARTAPSASRSRCSAPTAAGSTAAGLTPGARYYVSATAGALDDAATTGGTVAVAIAIDTTDIMVIG